MNEIHKINCIKKKEVTQLLKRFILFTFLDPDTLLSETLHPGNSFPAGGRYGRLSAGALYLLLLLIKGYFTGFNVI